MTLNPGAMRDRITLQTRGEPDPWGDGSDEYSDIATVWAQYRPMRGREFREGSVKLGEQRATFTVNYRNDLDQVDRIIHRGRGKDRIWDIRDVTPVGFKDGTDILVSRTDVAGNS